jgi:hypothetical protein
MNRIRRHRASFVLVLALLSVVLLGTGGAAAAPAGPALTSAAGIAGAPGTIAVTGSGFTPGGRVYVALYDVWGAKLYETRWTAASPTGYGPNGSQDPAVGFDHGGALSAIFGRLCGTTPMVRAYDESTETWSNWLDVGTTAFAIAHYGLDGSADPARGYTHGC